jgi:hypothetical protein
VWDLEAMGVYLNLCRVLTEKKKKRNQVKTSMQTGGEGKSRDETRRCARHRARARYFCQNYNVVGVEGSVLF